MINTIKEYQRQIRKVTKNNKVFPNNTTLEKLVYFVYRNIRKKMNHAYDQRKES